MALTALIFYISLALGVSFTCSILESVLLSLTHSHVQLQAKKKGRTGSILQGLKDDIEKPLSAILTLNTIAHTMGAIGVGAEIEKLYGSTVLTISSGLMTLAILLFSEILPKTIGAIYWKQLATPSSWILVVMIGLLYPIVMLIGWMRGFFPELNTNTVTREELSLLAEIAKGEKVIEEDESRVIKNLLRLKHITVEQEMTPRVVLTAFPVDLTVKEAVDDRNKLGFSRIPVYGENLDDLQGLVMRRDILESASRDEWDKTMLDLMGPIKTISPTCSVDEALDRFLGEKQHLMAVIDEFGGNDGIITIEDVIETLLGVEIMDETDSTDDMRALARDIHQANAEEE